MLDIKAKCDHLKGRKVITNVDVVTEQIEAFTHSNLMVYDMYLHCMYRKIQKREVKAELLVIEDMYDIA